MRLTQERTIQEATGELLQILKNKGPQSTSALVGTPKFHGTRTLTNSQIIRLLRASGRADYRIMGHGMRTWYVWRLTEVRSTDPTAYPGEIVTGSRLR